MRADICQPPPTATAERVSDAGITATIELFFLTEKGVAAHLIDVATHEGIVKLDGRIANPLARERAAGIALTERIRQRFFWSTSPHNQDVEVPVGQERATLISTVDTWLDREQAVLDAYEAGARDVDNDLLVSTAAGL